MENINDWIQSIPLDDIKTWDLIQSGRLAGVFQLEEFLGIHWAKKIKPSKIEHISDLIALIRPGVLEAYEDGKNMAQHYADRRNGDEEITTVHPKLTEILKSTYGIALFQEDSIRIAKELAGFSLQEADSLRKAVGRKDAELMTKTESLFLDKAKKVGILPDDAAKSVFENIRASQRYSFNKCLSPNSVVNTPDGEKTLREINIGDLVEVPSKNGLVFKKVINKYDNGIKEVLKVTLDNDCIIQCTANHKIYCRIECFEKENWIKQHTSIPIDTDIIDNISYVVIPLWLILHFKFNHLTLNKTHSYDVRIFTKKNGFVGIKQVEPSSYIETVDIEIDSIDHLYYANGIAVSNSHSMCYGHLGYYCAYLKVHYPTEFYLAWLQYAFEKQNTWEEINLLVEDAKYFNICIKPPTIIDLQPDFYIKNNCIYFGICNIKGIGNNVFQKIVDTKNSVEQTLGLSIDRWSWLDCLIYLCKSIVKTAIINIINTGGFDCFKIGRQRMLREYEIWQKLTEREQNIIIDLYNSNKEQNFLELLRQLATSKKNGGFINEGMRLLLLQSYVNSLDKPFYSIADSIKYITTKEKELLGCEISCSKIDEFLPRMVGVTHNCKDLSRANKAVVAIELTEVKEIVAKKGKCSGQTMAFLKGRDNICSVDNIVVFPDQYNQYKQYLKINDVVILEITRSKKSDGYIVNTVKPLSAYES